MDHGKILLTDDDVASTQLLQEILKREGYKVTAKYNGQQALFSAVDVDGIQTVRVPDLKTRMGLQLRAINQ